MNPSQQVVVSRILQMAEPGYLLGKTGNKIDQVGENSIEFFMKNIFYFVANPKYK